MSCYGEKKKSLENKERKTGGTCSKRMTSTGKDFSEGGGPAARDRKTTEGEGKGRED